ncbi:MAG TPA: phosphomannomutase/phosphoglucomutase [Candidatus Saccharimonadia bacterium]|jgi:phosphomannomutase|nr:phosphomannomutase/phosphoglucomutase [Candidatus Saccharimonadia bacterium]
MNITESIFKAYDIRGLVGTELTPDLAEAIGKASADWFPQDGVVAVGYDMRADSQGLADRVKEGLTKQGRDVMDIGQVTSDMIYFAVGRYDLAGGIMVTASHNPGKYNGIKIYRDQVTAVGLDSGLAEIRDAIVADKFKAPAAKAGSITPKDIVDEWVEHCLSFVTTPLEPYHIAIDAGNGMAGAILPAIQRKLPLHVEEMYYELDGSFPNHEANPMKHENLADLIKAVKDGGLDFGVAFDGDGDRAGLVDDLGRPVDGSVLIAMVAKHYLELYPGSEVVHEVRTSRATRELIKEWGGKPVRTKAGRVNIGPVMLKDDAPFGGETTGHLFFKENFFTDSGLIGALVAMVALTESGKKLSELVDEYRRYVMPAEQNFEVEDAKAVLARLKDAFADGEQDELDGLTVNYPDWWFNLRMSNTEPVVRLNIEAKDQAILDEQRKRVVDVITNA